MKERKKQVGKYFVFGVLNTAVGYGVYELLALFVFNGENQLWIATLISGAVGVVTGFFLHSKFTWKERKSGKVEMGKFLVWNILLALAVKPLLTILFELFDPLYKFAFDIFQAIHIPFSEEFVKTTGVFVLVTAVVMVLNFLVYDRFVFGKKTEKKSGEKKDMESVRETREEVE